MSDYFDDVEQSLRAALRGDAHLPWHARLKRRRARSGRRLLIVAIAGLVLGGSAAAAVLTRTGKSRPLSGTLPAQFIAEGGPIHTAGGMRYRLSVFPYLSVGWTGWCSSVNFTVRARLRATSYGCAPVESADPAMLSDEIFGGSAGEYQDAILSDRVAEVRYKDGLTIKPIADPRLPRWMRAVVRVYTQREASRTRLLGELFRTELLDANGQRLYEPIISSTSAVEHLPLIALNPKDPAQEPCAVRLRATTAGLIALTQTVAAPVSWPRRAPGGFLACANATYRLDGTDLGVAVLVNAVDPRALAEALPGLSRDPAHSGVLLGRELGTIGYPQGSSVWNDNPDTEAFDSTGYHPWDAGEENRLRDHNISARRAGRGWLIAEGGTAALRARLLELLQTDA